jgi:nicotinamidase-related amidase
MPSVSVPPSRRRVLAGLGAMGAACLLAAPGAGAAIPPRASRAGADRAALLVIDMQDAFLPGGRLPVDGGAALVPGIARRMRHYRTVVLTQDWHSRTGARPHAQIVGPDGRPVFLDPDDAAAGGGLAAALLARGIAEVHVAGLPGAFPQVWPAREPAAARLRLRILSDVCRTDGGPAPAAV